MILKRVLSSFLVLFTMLILMQDAEAADETESFSERAAGMSEIKNLRYSSGSGRIRIVLDVTKKIDFNIAYLEDPSRIVVDIDNAWISKDVPRDVSLNSTAASRIRIAQFDKTKVRLVIETSAENNIFYLPGGDVGGRLVIDIGADAEQPGFDQKVNQQSEQEVDRPFQNTPIKTEPIKSTPVEKEPADISTVPAGVPALDEKDSGKDIKDSKEKEKEEKEKKEREKKEKKEKEKERKEKEKEKKEKKEKEKKEKERKEKEKKEKEEKESKSDKDSKNDKNDKDDKYVGRKLENMTTLKGKKIVIDPGHGGNDSGAIGPSGVMEKTVTLKVALELEKLLEAEGAEVIMTRRTDVEVAPKGRAATDIEELKSRCDVANEAKADIFVSIHADSFTNPASRGTTGYYYSKGSANSKRLADCIRAALIEQIKTPSRGTQPCNFYVVRNTDMPATLIELAFISNPIEEALMNSKEGVQKAAQGIFDGIEDYFG